MIKRDDFKEVDTSNYQMRYQREGTRVLTGNTAIPNSLIKEYIGTICFATETTEGVLEYTDISLTRQQFEELRQAIDDYLNISCRLFPPAEQRYLPAFPEKSQ